MTRKARMWTGATLLAAVVINYAIMGIPLYRKAASIDEQSKAVLIRQVKSGSILKGGGDEYLLELFRKEKAAIDRSAIILNCAGITAAIFIASWTIFGIIFHRKR